MTKIGFLGPEGTFTQQACEAYIRVNKLSYDQDCVGSIDQLFRNLIDNKCDEIIVPVENSIEGVVPRCIDLLLNTDNVFIKEELYLNIKQCLLGTSTATESSITHVLSHPQPLAQCQQFIQSHFPEADIQSALSTAAAAQYLVAQNQKSQCDHMAIIGHQSLSQIYGLKLLVENINDKLNNQTRFFIVSMKEPPVCEASKTTIVFSAQKDQPGSLYDILGEFAERKINLTSIGSRPTKANFGDYLFFIDCEGHKELPKIKEALSVIEKRASFFKCLGSYKGYEVNNA